MTRCMPCLTRIIPVSDTHDRIVLSLAFLLPQVVLLYAIQRGYLDAVAVASMPQGMAQVVAHLRTNAAAALADIAKSRILTAAAEHTIETALKRFVYRATIA